MPSKQKATVKVAIAAGDITTIPAEAMIAPLKSSGEWHEHIKDAIRKCVGQQFHDCARAAMPLQDGQAVVARRRRRHKGTFRHVLFAIDDCGQALSGIVLSGLLAADKAGFKTVTLPMFRTGAADEVIREITIAMRVFLRGTPQSIESITLVCEDASVRGLLHRALPYLEPCPPHAKTADG